MMTYLLLNLTWLILAWLLVRWLRPSFDPIILIRAGLVLYVAIVVFNTYLTALPIVQYNPAHLLGVKILSWPIEDMAYLVVALYVAPAVYGWLFRHYASGKATHELMSPKGDPKPTHATTSTKSAFHSSRRRSEHSAQPTQKASGSSAKTAIQRAGGDARDSSR